MNEFDKNEFNKNEFDKESVNSSLGKQVLFFDFKYLDVDMAHMKILNF